jgi:hypothetical protein
VRVPRLRTFGASRIAAFLCIGCFGCATHYNWHASVEILGVVGARCMSETLAGEPDVFDVVKTGPEQFAFQLQMPDVATEDAPSFSLHRTRNNDGDPVLTLSTAYAEGLFASGGPQRTRARDLIEEVTEQCTGRRPRLGGAEPCGAGEPKNLCLVGRYDD